MKRIALCLALLATVAACGSSPSAPDTPAAPGDARFDGSQMGSGSRNPPTPPADTTGLGG
jgi:opacity protein-like surface antigen